VAHDGDADRATFVDETGEFVNGDAALAALVGAAVEPGDAVVSAVNVSQRVADVVEAAGADLTLTAIGSTNIITRIRELQADGEHVAVAGEGNGGVIYPDYRIARDGAYTAAKFCELVAERPASEVAGAFDGYANVREAVGYADETEETAMIGCHRGRRPRRRRRTGHDGRLPTRLRRRLGWRAPSGTEPVIRIYAEARTEKRAEELAAMFGDAVRRVQD